MESVYTESLNGLEIKILFEEDAESPDTWRDKGAFLVGYHDQFYVTRDDIISKTEVKGLFSGEEISQTADYYIFPLSTYIHSGVALYLGSYKKDCWDSCLVGAVLISRKELDTEKQAYSYAENLVKTWNDYLSGNVYGYEIYSPEGDIIDSCWGFYGDYEKNALEEARNAVNSITNNGKTDHHGQLLFKCLLT